MEDPILEAFLFETSQQLGQLEQVVIEAESVGNYSENNVTDIFRFVHTIKGSAAMMQFKNIATVAHSTEDLFYFIRENRPSNVDTSSLCDLVLEAVDFIKLELEKIKNGDKPDNDETRLIKRISSYLKSLKQIYNLEEKEEQNITHSERPTAMLSIEKPANEKAFKAIIRFDEDCEMRNIHAYVIVHNLEEISNDFFYLPKDITENEKSEEIIKKDGFIINFKTDKSYEEMYNFFSETAYVKSFELTQLDNLKAYKTLEYESCHFTGSDKIPHQENLVGEHARSNIISVNIHKIDKLLNLVGEMVISESMVSQNPDLKGLPLHNFYKAARQLRKITGEIQGIVMSIRMLPIGPTFFKMNRIVRDMKKKLNKEVNLKIIGEDTEVDKNIIENLEDPLMHLVRNAVDHGIETPKERVTKGKGRSGTLTLEAKNAGNEVFVVIKDDGQGLNKKGIIKKARENNLLNKNPEEMTDKEIYNLIFLPGFSTNEKVTEYSGRGVGMDVVLNNVQAVGGSIQIESDENGTTILLKIPLTLAIIDGMNLRVGMSRYTLPTTSIKESFRPNQEDIFKDPDGNEMIIIRGNCYPIIRLHDFYNVQTEIKEFDKGIFIVIENDDKSACLFVDELLGKQQVVVKALPEYIQKIKKIKGLAGCTLLGDGSISLILDASGLIT
ncbi:chemotaxis protein CheA [Sporolactobacillus putidus]|uniref:Chemotaxis protein CheA n=1 Tax=Sporolactobacillus putidus TaxID=492735 RepID=A0A917W1F1_9BACL|nr:chemotaxis protein CheA [Sporolactobacillus putidus]GGL57505.1 chemotaxis protein CheA [Sporolactobacillus putidus]